MFDYFWIVIAGGIASFTAAMGIGANDVANAFASSVGSKALTVKSAVLIASIFECAGAVLMGSHVAKTIRKDIADYECFEDSPDIFIYGCFSVLISVTLWLFMASYLEMPVSTTHSCVGGMIGMTMITGGYNCVIWYKETNSFPFIGGVSGIVLSWFISPIFSALIAGFIYYITRLTILRRDNSFDKAYVSLPIFVGLTLLLNSFFIIYKGGKGIGLDDISAETSILISLGISLFSSLSIIPFIPKLKQKVIAKFNNQTLPEKVKCIKNKENPPEVEIQSSKCNKYIINLKKNINYDVENEFTNDKIKEIHDKSEKFDKKTEESFKYLQIFTAICASFSHGANDVANAIGPYAAIVMIYTNDGELSNKVEMNEHAYWILGMGGIGITIGLLLYGYKIIKAIGVKLCCITPSRGFSIELGSASIIIIGSRLGIPLSTTHCQVGATLGVAALDDVKNCTSINWKIAFKVFAGWIITLIVVGGTSALLTAQGIYSPSKYGRECDIMDRNITNITN